MSVAIHFKPLNKDGCTISWALFELVSIDLYNFLEILDGQGVVFNVEVSDKFVSLLSNLPPLQKLAQLGINLIDSLNWQGLSVLVIPAALLPVLFRYLPIEEAETGCEA